MTRYRRNFVPGGSFFFTVNLAERRLRLLTEHIDLLRKSFRITRARHPFDRGGRRSSRSSPRHLDVAGRQCRLRHALAIDQSDVYARAATRRTDFSQSRCKERTRDLAETLLGTHPARRMRFLAAYGRHPFQPGETWIRHASERLALFIVPSPGQAWHISRRLGRRRRAGGQLRRTVVIVGWVERGETHRLLRFKAWVLLRSTHPTGSRLNGVDGRDEPPSAPPRPPTPEDLPVGTMSSRRKPIRPATPRATPSAARPAATGLCFSIAAIATSISPMAPRSW